MNDLWKALRVAVNLNNMDELKILENEAGLDPYSQDYQLRQSLAEEDDNLLERLVRIRKAKGLSQQDVADRMNRNRSAVCNFERLGHDPHLSTIRRYAAAIGAYVRHEVRDADLISPAEYHHYDWASVFAKHFDASYTSALSEVWRNYEDSHTETIAIFYGGDTEYLDRSEGHVFRVQEKGVLKGAKDGLLTRCDG